MKRIKQTGFLLLAGFVLSGANLYLQTSVNPSTGNIILNLHKKKLEINLFSPEVTATTYPNGTLKHLSFTQVGTHYEIDFYPGDPTKKERISLYKEFKWFGNQLVVDGVSIKFSEEGERVSFSNYKNGELHGTQQLYRKGILVDEKLFEQGLPIKTWKQYYSNGVVAKTLSFPSSMAEWKKAEETVNRREGMKNTLYGSILPKKTAFVEEWFSEEGKKLKEIQYEASKQGKKVKIIDTQESVTFNQEGEVTKESHWEGSYLVKTSYHKKEKVPYKVSSYWLNDKKMREEKVRL